MRISNGRRGSRPVDGRGGRAFSRRMQLGSVDTNLVVTLLALLRHQNVTRAAREVGLSQSSMSHALARLRAQFADPLLVPAGRGLVLSERGKELVEPVATAVAA